jgi:predicted DNA-binding transcriptional regulator YafY
VDRTERFYEIDQLLDSRRMVSMDLFIEELGVSRDAVTRKLGYMIARLTVGGAYAFYENGAVNEQ